MSRLEKKLIKMNACCKAIDWASGQTGSFQESWDQCPKGDWMLWLLARSKSNKKKLVLVNCQIARTVLKYVPKGEERPLKAIMAAESWVKGEVDLKEVKKANTAAYAAWVDAWVDAYADDKRKASYLNLANIIRKLFPKYPK